MTRSVFAGGFVPIALLVMGAAHPARGEDVAAGRWGPAGSLSVGRYAPGAALLADGRVVVAGGYSFETRRTHTSTELFDPAKNEWAAGPALERGRNFPLVLPLPEGDLLFAAGFRIPGGTTPAVDRLVAADTRFRMGPDCVEERELADATRLAGGRFLITGGYSTRQRKTLDSAEIYDPKADRFVAVVGALRSARFGHTGVLLSDGRVLICGGKVLATDERVLPAELFDPRTGEFCTTGALSVGRDRCTAWLLPDGKRVITAGGAAKEGGTRPAARCEIYDVSSGTWSPGPELVRDRMAHTMTLLDAGRVLLVGGWSSSDNRTTRDTEVWDPKAARFLPAGMLEIGRHDHVAVRLRDGRVVVAGGKEAPARAGIETPLPAEAWTPL